MYIYRRVRLLETQYKCRYIWGRPEIPSRFYLRIPFWLSKTESAKLRNLCALVPHVPSGPTSSRTLRAIVPYVPRVLRALVHHVFSCLTCIVPFVLPCLVFHVLPTLCSLRPRALWALFPYWLVPCVLYVLISPFVLLSFYASRSCFSVCLLLVIWWGNLLNLKQI